MKEIVKIFYKVLFLFLVIFSSNVHGKILSSGDSNAKVTVKVFSSLTCPACANFHSEIYYDLKKDLIDAGLVKFEHHPFPLDLAALNAEIILRCNNKEEKNRLCIIYIKFKNSIRSTTWILRFSLKSKKSQKKCLRRQSLPHSFSGLCPNHRSCLQ